METTGDVGGAQSIGRAALLLRAVGTLGEAGLADVVVHSGLAKPTVRRILRALMEAGLVEQDAATRRYRLGVETYVLGQLSASRFGVHRLALDGLHRLARISEDTAFLSVRRGFAALCLHREEGQYPIRTHVLNPGHRHPLGVGAAGLAMLAALDDDEAEGVLQTNAAEIAGAFPGVTVADTRRRLAMARRTGWSLNPGLVFPGSWGIAVAVRDPRGEPVAALTLAAIEPRLQPERQATLGRLLRAEAAMLEGLLARMENPERHGLAALPPQPARRTAS
jgi:DNA-binding IclR family transcriptional regulator